MKDKITIANASGYWGDDPNALRRQVKGGPVDYITMDFLAEVTMSIMQKQKSRKPELGYARNFIDMVVPLAKDLVDKNICVITNAGGVNPQGLAEQIRAKAKENSVDLRIVVIDGDDLMGRFDELTGRGCSFENMESAERFAPVKDKMQAANVYLGARPVAEALKKSDKKPHLILTGRVTDTGITVAPMIAEFGWDYEDWDKLASGVVAGHLLECGSQSTGGNLTDWTRVGEFARMGFPIVDVSPDGSFELYKHPDTGGLVCMEAAKEQLFYEMGDPQNYITPDVVADFTSISIEEFKADSGDIRVRVRGIKGLPATPFFKISMAYEDGYKVSGSVLVGGPNAPEKAKKFADVFWSRLKDPKSGIDFSSVEETLSERIGYDACHGALSQSKNPAEVLLRLGARGSCSSTLGLIARRIPALILSGPCGVAAMPGVAKPSAVMRYWPALIQKELVDAKVHLPTGKSFVVEEPVPEAPHTGIGDLKVQVAKGPQALSAFSSLLATGKTLGQRPLSDICYGRSGDKGDSANIGLIARSEEAYVWIKENITADLVRSLFEGICSGSVERFELDNLRGLNFLLHSSLGGGGTVSLRIDPQGKTLAHALLSQPMNIPPLLFNA